MQDPAREALSERDDALHEPGATPGWRERLTFFFADASSGFAGVARMNLHPVEGTADAALNVFLPGDALATSLAKGTFDKRTTVGRLEFTAREPLKAWTVSCTDTALVFPKATAAGLPSAGERHGAAARISLDLQFEGWGEPVGSVLREKRTDEMNFVQVTSHGRLEQACRVTGTIRVGNRQGTVDAGGIRERTWGREAADTGSGRAMWLGVAFDPKAALVARGPIIGDTGSASGWSTEGPLTDVAFDVGAEGRAVRRVKLHLPGGALNVDVRTSLPIKDRGMRVQQSLVSCRAGGREAWGIAEFTGDDRA